MSNEPSAQVWETLLNDFLEQVPPRPESPPTLPEITGNPPRGPGASGRRRFPENVCSNILEFFLDPGKPHGLGTLFLDALACIGGIEHQQGMWANVEVTREEKTKTEKRIDILIWSDTHAVLIENKIFHAVANPLGDYAECLDDSERFPQSQGNKYRILLTLKPISEGTKRDIKRYDFRHITHEELVKKIRELLGDHISGADTRYLTFMLDFLNTLDILREDVVMDQMFLEFARSHQAGIESLVGQVRKFQNERRGKINQLEKLVGGLSNHNKVRSEKWKETDQMWDDLVHEVELGDGSKIVIEAWVSAEGWQFPIYFKETKDNARLAELLSKQKIPYEEKDGDISHKKRFGYDADLKDIADLLQDVVSNLADVRSSGNY